MSNRIKRRRGKKGNKRKELSSKKMDWKTPPEILRSLDKRFIFTVDAASKDPNPVIPRHWTPKDDGLKQDWSCERVFCNPPYGNQVPLWLQKAAETPFEDKGLAVLLVPPKPCTKYWKDFVHGKARVIWLRGRIAFLDENGKPKKDNTQDSCLVIYGGGPSIWRFIPPPVNVIETEVLMKGRKREE